MTMHYIKPVINHTVRNLCFKPYHNHRKGCPNYGKRKTCPPQAPLINEFFDLDKRIMAVCVHFNLKLHRQKMKLKHPKWSKRQLECCLYWQGGVRKRLRQEVVYNLTRETLFDGGTLIATDRPEAMGVDVTETMKNAGVILEWPPEKTVLKIAFIGSATDDKGGG